ncbi:MAG: hypothetical protein ABI588_09160 [Arenimonas sp.]
MQYQLVFRFRKLAFEAADGMQALELALAGALAGTAQLDGHDTGKRDIDLFLLTADPGSTFRRSKPVLEKLALLDKVTVAHRLEGGARFTVLWPLGYGRKFSLS